MTRAATGTDAGSALGFCSGLYTGWLPGWHIWLPLVSTPTLGTSRWFALMHTTSSVYTVKALWTDQKENFRLTLQNKTSLNQRDACVTSLLTVPHVHCSRLNGRERLFLPKLKFLFEHNQVIISYKFIPIFTTVMPHYELDEFAQKSRHAWGQQGVPFNRLRHVDCFYRDNDLYEA